MSEIKLEEKIEIQIIKEQKDIRFESKEYTIEVFVKKYSDGLSDDNNEVFIPDYQRDFVWDEITKSRFIESLLIGLPIPFIFTSDIEHEDPELDGRVEVIDGSQRLRTLHQFINNELTITSLNKLTELNSYKFDDMPTSRKRRFLRQPLRVIELKSVTEEVRRDLFERINTGFITLNPMEIRRGSEIGDSKLYKNLIKPCSELELFIDLTPMNQSKINRREREELVLRFFAYRENYSNFDHKVIDFLNNFIKSKLTITDSEIKQYKNDFISMLDFVKNNFATGFRKTEKGKSVPRVRFEAISVGVSLALSKKKNISIEQNSISEFLNSDDFKEYTTSDASNSKAKVIQRIEFVRDKLLGGTSD